MKTCVAFWNIKIKSFVRNHHTFKVYLHDWGPNAGMEWTFARQLGNPTPKTIISGNVEHAYPLNMCLIDASRVQGFSVWDENKWKSDPTFSIVCTVFY